MSAISLGDICEVTAGQSAPQDPSVFGEEGKPFIRAGSLEKLINGVAEEDCERIPVDNAARLRLRLFPQDTILFAKSGMSAKIGRVHRLRTPSYIVSHLAAVIPGKKVNPSYLQRWFEKNPPSRLIPNEAYPSIKISEISLLKINLPALPEQKRIAAILDKADAVRRKRQQAIKLADEFLRATFLDMFGDPIINAKKWPIEPLESFSTDVVDCPHSTPKYSDYKTPFPCLRSSDLQDGHLVFETTKYVDENVYRDRIARITPMQGDIIYCREGARLGNLAIVPEGLTPCLGQRTMLFRVNQNEAAPNFLLTLLNNNGIKNQVSKKIIGAAAPRVNVKELKEFQIIKPPIALQHRYEKIVLKYRLNRQRYLAHQQLSNHAFNALNQRAFQGNL